MKRVQAVCWSPRAKGSSAGRRARRVGDHGRGHVVSAGVGHRGRRRVVVPRLPSSSTGGMSTPPPSGGSRSSSARRSSGWVTSESSTTRNSSTAVTSASRASTCPIGRGQGVVDVLHRHCREHDIDIAVGQRVDRLLTVPTAPSPASPSAMTRSRPALSCSPPAASATTPPNSLLISLRPRRPDRRGTSAPKAPAATRSISAPRSRRRRSVTTAGCGCCTPASRPSTRRTCRAG